MFHTKLQPIQSSDLPAIYAIEQQQAFPWTLPMLTECLQSHYENWLLKVDEMIIGFAILRIVQDEGELLNIAVQSQQRRKGYGAQLLQQLIDRAKQLQVKKIFLEVRASNAAAQKLYQRFGFTNTGIRQDYYRDASGREDAIMMMLVL